MTSTWKLSDAFYMVFHRWPQVVLFILAGGLVGWGIGYATPARYRAETQVYVAFNPYRAKNDSQFLAIARPKYTNIDDYKNWQMAQLDAFLMLEDVLQPVLEALRQQDPYWQELQVDELRSILSTEWRNPGSWSLAAERPQAKLAEQAAHTWAEVAIDLIQQSVSASQQAIMLDEQSMALAAEQAQMESSKQELLALQSALQEWLQRVGATGLEDPLVLERPLPNSERLQLIDLTALAAAASPAIAQILESQPDTQAPTRQALDWAQALPAAIQLQIDVLTGTAAQLQQQQEKLADEFALVNPLSTGLSANLEVQEIQPHRAEQLQSNALLAMVGGAIGLCAWALTALYALYRREEKA